MVTEEVHEALRLFTTFRELSGKQADFVAAHFTECEDCRTKAREKGLYPGGHLSDDEAFSFSNDDVYESNWERMSEHLNTCVECALLVAFYDAGGELELAENGDDGDEPATEEELLEMSSGRWPYLPWKRGEGFVSNS